MPKVKVDIRNIRMTRDWKKRELLLYFPSIPIWMLFAAEMSLPLSGQLENSIARALQKVVVQWQARSQVFQLS